MKKNPGVIVVLPPVPLIVPVSTPPAAGAIMFPLDVFNKPPPVPPVLAVTVSPPAPPPPPVGIENTTFEPPAFVAGLPAVALPAPPAPTFVLDVKLLTEVLAAPADPAAAVPPEPRFPPNATTDPKEVEFPIVPFAPSVPSTVLAGPPDTLAPTE